MSPADAPRPGGVVRARVPPDLAPFARELFPDYAVTPEPGGDAPPDVAAVALEGGGFRVGSRAPEAWDAPDASAAMVAFELVLAETLLRGTGGVRVLHGAGVVLPGGAVVMPGFGGAGKSTLAAALARRGRPVYGDDVVLVDEAEATVSPFRRLLKVPEDSRARLGLPRRGTPLDDLWPRSAFFRPEDLGGAWARPGAVAAVLFPVRGSSPGAGRVPGGSPELVPVEPAEAVRRLLAQALMVERAEAGDFAAVARLLDGAGAAELRYDDAAEAADFLLEAELPRV